MVDEMEVIIDVEAGEICFGQKKISVTHEESADFDAHQFGSISGKLHHLIRSGTVGESRTIGAENSRNLSWVIHFPLGHE